MYIKNINLIFYKLILLLYSLKVLNSITFDLNKTFNLQIKEESN